MSRVLGLDYGTKRVGVAISDPSQVIATGLKTVSNSDIFIFLDDVIKKMDISCMVVGYPLNLDGSETDVAILVHKFLQKLAHRFPNIQLEKMDERFTSKIAKQAILLSGVKKMKRRNKELIDEVSATIILQDYLDCN